MISNPDEIYSKYNKMVWAIVWKVTQICLKSKNCLEDLFQEGFLMLLDAYEKYNQKQTPQDASVSTFIYLIVIRGLRRICSKCETVSHYNRYDPDLELDSFTSDKNPEHLYMQKNEKDRILKDYTILETEKDSLNLLNQLADIASLSENLVQNIVDKIMNLDEIIDRIIIEKIVFDGFKREEICRQLSLSRGNLDYRLDKIHKIIGVSLKDLKSVEIFKEKLREGLSKPEGIYES